MRDLPLALRAYLVAIYIACLGLVVLSLTEPWPHMHVARWGIALFVLLSYLGERTQLRMFSTMSQSLSTPVHVAAILIFPAPFPVLITLLGVLVPQLVHERKPAYKRAFNICHPVLAVGCSSLLLSLVDKPDALLQPHHVATAIPALLLLLTSYYLFDVGTLLGVLSLSAHQSPWLVWRETYFPTLLPEVSAGTIGALAAMVWAFDEVGVSLVVVPVVALRIALRAITQAEDRAQALRRRSEQLEVVLAAGQRLRLQRTRADLLRPVAEAARALSGAETVGVYMRDPDDPDRLERVVLIPADAAIVGPKHLVRPESGSPWQENETPEDGHVLVASLEVDGGDVAGVLRLADMPAEFGADDRDALAILATQAAIALENAGLHERALAQASEDGLTGLLNHRAFQTRLQEEIARVQRHGRPVAVMMVDLDDFGTINNTYGHQIGDAALASMARAIQGSVRVGDIAARYGGDEFAVIMPEASADEAYVVAQRVQDAIVASCVDEHGVLLRVGASIGVAAMPDHGRTREEVIRAADQAAYAAKQAGKCRVSRPEDAVLTLDDNPDVLARQLQHANMTTVEALAVAVDAKDAYTRGHSLRVSSYAVALARALQLSATDIARVRLAGLLHDVGKIGIPDVILTKAGKLDDAEFAIIKQHPAIGERMLASVTFLREILPAVRHHHERWDGRGYPDGLTGDAIPWDAAILMVADSFDAMTSSRTYRAALPTAEAVRRVREGSGTQYAPDIVAAFDRALADGTLELPSVGPSYDHAA